MKAGLVGGLDWATCSHCDNREERDTGCRKNVTRKEFVVTDGLDIVCLKFFDSPEDVEDKEKKCKWTEDPDGYFKSDCGKAFCFHDFDVDQLCGFRFCPFCGKPIEGVFIEVEDGGE